jgi:hypothetical protein
VHLDASRNSSEMVCYSLFARRREIVEKFQRGQTAINHITTKKKDYFMFLAYAPFDVESVIEPAQEEIDC